MRPTLVKLVALLMVVLQGAITSGPARVLCIPLQDCGHHHESAALGGHENGPNTCGPVIERVGCHIHEHGPFDTPSLADDPCACHVHVPVPDQKQLPSNAKGDSQDPRSFLVPMAVAILIAWEFEPPRTPRLCLRPPDFSTSDQVCGLKVTRLRI